LNNDITDKYVPIEDVEKIFKVLNTLTGMDFSRYRQKMMTRRLAYHMRLIGCESVEDYISILRQDAAEPANLLNSLTINVTSFFRDSLVYDRIAESVLPLLFETINGAAGKTLRVWSCCSSAGQEATSVAILAQEHMQRTQQPHPISICATDIDPDMLEQGRSGTYDNRDFVKMPVALRQKYFSEISPGLWQRSEDLDAWLEFRKLDIVDEAPLKNQDLVLCRNALIYFTRELQETCMAKFAQALKPGGFLVLGMTETFWEADKKGFDVFDGPGKIYRKR